MRLISKIFTQSQLLSITIHLKNFPLKIEGSIENSQKEKYLLNVLGIIATLEADGSLIFTWAGSLGLRAISNQLMTDVRQVFEQRGEAIPRDLEILARSFVTYVLIEAIEQAGMVRYRVVMLKRKAPAVRVTAKDLSFDYVATFLNPFLVIMTDAEVRAGFKITYLKLYMKKALVTSYVRIIRTVRVL